MNLKNFLKGKERINKVARHVAAHYVGNVEPLGYKALLVAVDREACALYKEAFDSFLEPEFSAVVYTGTNYDPPQMKKWHLDEKTEKQIRQNFTKIGQQIFSSLRRSS